MKEKVCSWVCYPFPTSSTDSLAGPIHTVTHTRSLTISAAINRRWCYRTVYRRADGGRTRSECISDADKHLTEYSYDGALMKEERFYQIDALAHTKLFTYDECDRLISVLIQQAHSRESSLLERWHFSSGGLPLLRTEMLGASSLPRH